MPYSVAGGGLRIEFRGLERLRANENELRAVLRGGVKRIAQTVRKRLRGRGRSGRRYRKDGRTVTASRPSEAPAQFSGLLAKSVGYETGRGLTAAAKVRAPHTHFLFLGTRYMERRPDVMAEALEEHDEDIADQIGAALGRVFEGESS